MPLQFLEIDIKKAGLPILKKAGSPAVFFDPLLSVPVYSQGWLFQLFLFILFF